MSDEPDDLSSARPSTSAQLIGADGKVDLDAVRALGMTDEPRTPGQPGDEDRRRVSFTLSRDLRKRLDQYITDRVPFLSRSQAQKLIDAGAVTVNGALPKHSTILRQRDVVGIVIPPQRPSRIEPEPMELDVLYEDDYLLVLNKRPGVIVHPARSHTSGTLINGLAWRFEREGRQGASLSGVGADDARPGVVHRLDRDTSGVIVFAKDDLAHWRLGRQFEKRRVEKRYIAVVHGAVEPIADVIDLPLGPHPNRAKGYREKQVVRHDSFGKPSVTLYRALELFDGYSLLELELRTGRTHQIRVHLSHLGWPVVGDDMYGGRAVTLGDLSTTLQPADEIVINRQALHAAMLSFDHPITQERMTFAAPFRGDMTRLIQMLRQCKPGAGVTGVVGAGVDLGELTQ